MNLNPSDEQTNTSPSADSLESPTSIDFAGQPASVQASKPTYETKRDKAASGSTEWGVTWSNGTKDYPTENLLETKQLQTVGALNFDHAPTEKPIQADGFQIGDLIDERYKLIHILGIGASAIVWLANDQDLERLVAVKIFRLAFLEDVDPAILAYEARIMARFEHPSILPIYDIGEHKDRPFLILKFVPQQSASQKVLSPRIAAKVIIQAAEALQFLHSKGVIHCDIKPGNILIGPTGQAYLSDYGIAMDRLKLPSFEHQAGTPGFIAPERLSGMPVSSNSDIFSLGIVLFYYLTGFIPENHDSASLIQHLKHVPKSISKVILKSVAIDSRKRFNDMNEVIQGLRVFITKRHWPKWQKALIATSAATLTLAVTYWMLEDYLFPGPEYPIQTLQISSPGFDKIVHGDWDSDGDQDLGVFNPSSGVFDVFFNNGKGSLSLIETMYRDNQQTDMNSGYFLSTERVSMLHSFDHRPIVYSSIYKSGRFIVETNSTNLSLISPVEPKTADFNKDNIPDLLVLDKVSPEISLRMGSEKQYFQEEIIFFASEFENSKTIGVYIEDFNHDHLLDFAVGVQGTDINPSGITVFLQIQAGLFDKGRFYEVMGNVNLGYGTVADADQDSHPDILLPDRIGSQIIQFKNDGNGFFQTKKNLYKINQPINVVNLDPSSSSTKLELAIGTNQPNICIVGLGDDNQWRTVKEYHWPMTNRGMIATDIDNDGTLDLVVNSPNGNRLFVVHRKRFEP